MRILITGGSGFIGFPTAVAMRSRGHDVTVVGRSPIPPQRLGDLGLTYTSQDLNDSKAVRRLIEDISPDTVVHLAWYTTPKDYLVARAENLASLAASIEILTASERAGTSRVVIGGTCLEDAASGVDSVYARSKRLLHQVALDFQPPSETVVTCAHLYSVYGPREHPDRVIPTMIRTLDRGEPFIVSAPDPRRDYVHVEDAASALAVIAEQCPGGQVDVCVGPGSPQRETFELVARLVGRRDLLSFARASTPGVRSYDAVGDPTTLRALGWSPRYTLETGLRSTVEWWRRASVATRD